MASMICASLTLAITLALVSQSYGNEIETKALLTFKGMLSDPNNALQSWVPDTNPMNMPIDPCNWVHVHCNLKSGLVEALDLEHGDLGGTLSPELTKLTSLKYLNMTGNSVGGTIPITYGDLTNLKTLDLSNNKLTGTIPAALGKLRSLQSLALNHNGLTGGVPKELTDIFALTYLDLSNNNLCGTFPAGFQQISTLNLGNNPSLGIPGPGCP